MVFINGKNLNLPALIIKFFDSKLSFLIYLTYIKNKTKKDSRLLINKNGKYKFQCSKSIFIYNTILVL